MTDNLSAENELDCDSVGFTFDGDGDLEIEFHNEEISRYLIGDEVRQLRDFLNRVLPVEDQR